MVNNVEKLYIT